MAGKKKLDPAAPRVPNKLVRFTVETIGRNDIVTADYNPRVITDDAAAKIVGILNDTDIGLVEPLVYNKRTGRLVGGHQRLAAMDAINGAGVNYEVPVSVIDVDEKIEKEINIILNNPSAQGEWDVNQLEALFRDSDINPWQVGFTNDDMTSIFPAEVWREFGDRYLLPSDPAPQPEPGSPDQEHVQTDAEKIADMKEARQKHRDVDGEAMRADHTIVLVFNDPDETTRALAALRLNPTEQFVRADDFFAAVARVGGVISYAPKVSAS